MIQSSILFRWFCLAVCLAWSKSQSITDLIENSKPSVVLKDGNLSTDVKIDRKWIGNIGRISVTSNSYSTVNIKEVVMFTTGRSFEVSTAIYAQGFQLLSQTGGTLGQPQNIGYFTESLTPIQITFDIL